MKTRRLRLGLPLLARELAEQSSHARHYVLRCICAITMFGFCFVALRDLLVADQAAAQISLGRGLVLIDSVTQTQSLMILIFLPAITCGAIAGEKERNTLAILLTTRLGPVTIVLEKLVSRLVIVFMLLLLSLPLYAVAYSMGGVSLPLLLNRVKGLAGLSVFVASLSLMCSAWCGSTASAFFMSYFVAGALILGGIGTAGYFMAFQATTPSPLLLQALVVFLSVFFLFVASRCLISRAFVTPRNFVLAFFRGLDRLYTQMNVIVGNVVLVREKALLPADQPIAWRETSKKSLGTVRYLVRVLVAIELPTAFLLVVASESPTFNLNRGFAVGSWLWFIVWGVSAALIAVSAASIVSGERTRQTLPVLLATPMPGNEIVRQLFAGVRRLISVLWIPFATIAVFQYWFQRGAFRFGVSTAEDRLACSLLQIVVYPYLIAWITFYLGTRARSALWAVLSSLLALLAVILLPYAAVFGVLWFDPGSSWGPDLALAFSYASPATVVAMNEAQGITRWHMAASFAAFGALTLFIRARCLSNADRLLGRTVSPYGYRGQRPPASRAFALPRAAHRRPDAAPVNTPA
jgi:ABC-type transport system involved in multi-copper enzyme maturation permease subunit